MIGKHRGEAGSKGIYEELEGVARGQIQAFIQGLLEEEITELMGRVKGERKASPEEQEGYRNGYGKRWRFALSMGTIEVKRPRVRGLEERFESKILPLFKRHSREVRELLPELYLHGLASGDFELALRGLLGAGAPLSASSLQRLKGAWEVAYEEWKAEPIEEAEVAYLWADGIYVKAGLGKEKCALLVVIGAMKDGSKRFLALEPGYRESRESWAGVLRQMKARGLNEVRLIIGDGNLGLWAAVGDVFPEAAEQMCWNHKALNVLDAVSKKEQPQAKQHVRDMMYADSRAEAVKARKKFETAFQHNGKAVRSVVDNWSRLTAYYDFPAEHWKHLRTSNIVESPFSRVRLRTAASRRFKSQTNATCLIWKTMMISQKTFRKLNAPHLVEKVAEGRLQRNGKETRVAA